MKKQYDWIEFYKAFAKRLLDYKTNRKALIEAIVGTYQAVGVSMPTLESEGTELLDIDPFTTMGLFNKSSMTQENRIKIISELKKRLGVSVPVPTSFDGIPVLNNQNATFYYFTGSQDRKDKDIDNLWELLESALQYADAPDADNKKAVSKCFNAVINKKGNGNSKITMSLYWISPEVFLNLDNRNEWYIYKSGKIPSAVVASLPKITAKIAADSYFKIVESLRKYLTDSNSELKNFVDLSYEAWRYSEEVNQQKKTETQGVRDNKGAAVADDGVDTVHYWIYSPGDGAFKWDEFYKKGIMAIGWGDIGDLSIFSSKDEMKEKMKACINPSLPYKNAAHATWQFAKEMKPGDVVFAKKGMHQIIGRGVVESDYYFDGSVTDDYKNVRKVKWSHNGSWPHPGQAVMKTLTDITAYTDYVAKLNALFENPEEDDVMDETPTKTYPTYSPEHFLKEVYMDEENYNTLVGLLEAKKNVILQGAPGVGKTYAAKRLAYSIMGVKDPTRVMMVQFHQSYSYEDFIMGYRPTENGFELKKGAFYEFCKKAEEDDINTPYYFIIDEINRGNLSKIFGELFMLIENDKRGVELQLLYSDEKFSIPANVYIIGMMNTADRSLAMLDYALRRRFAFYEMTPGFETDGFREYRQKLGSSKFDNLIACVETLNGIIASDESLGEGFLIGHSYFCNLQNVDDAALKRIVDYELVPLLKEYWFDEPTKVKDWAGNLRSSIK